jgi:ATP-dependent helicase HrpA
MLADKVAALLKSLPQKYRRHLLPLDQWAAGFVERAGDAAGARGLMVALIDSLREHASIRVAQTDFRVETVPAHLQMNFRVIDEHGRFLAVSRNLAQLRAQLGASAQGSFQAALRSAGVSVRAQAMAPVTPALGSADELSRPQGSAQGRAQGSDPTAISSSGTSSSDADGKQTAASDPSRQAGAARDATVRRAGERFTAWDFGELPASIAVTQGGRRLTAHPGIEDEGKSVALRLFDTESSATASTRRGVVRLMRIEMKEPMRMLEKRVRDQKEALLALRLLSPPDALVEDVVAAVADRAYVIERGEIRYGGSMVALDADPALRAQHLAL